MVWLFPAQYPGVHQRHTPSGVLLFPSCLLTRIHRCLLSRFLWSTQARRPGLADLVLGTVRPCWVGKLLHWESCNTVLCPHCWQFVPLHWCCYCFPLGGSALRHPGVGQSGFSRPAASGLYSGCLPQVFPDSVGCSASCFGARHLLLRCPDNLQFQQTLGRWLSDASAVGACSWLGLPLSAWQRLPATVPYGRLLS